MIKINTNKIDYRHIVCLLIIAVLLICSFIFFPNALGRVIESIRDFGLSFGYYFAELLGIEHNINVTVNDLPKIPFFGQDDVSVVPTPPSDSPVSSVPDTWEGFKLSWKNYWSLFISSENIIEYLSLWINILFYVSQVLLLFIVPVFCILYLLFKRYMKKQNNHYNEDSKALKILKKISSVTYLPVKRWIASFVNFVKEHSYYFIVWLVIISFSFNLITIVIEFFSYYMYFVVSFDFSSLYRQFYKLSLDLMPLFNMPVIVLIIIGLVIVNKICKSIAYARLQHMEMKDRGFINSMPIVYMVCGTMGKKKTTTVTDMALSQEAMFRDKAFEKILENDLKFPNFPWINLENSLKEAMDSHEIYNLASCRNFIYKLKNKWESDPSIDNIFDYDYQHYSLTYNDNLKVINVWEVIESYAQLYFIYVIQSSLLISNYSIRTDAVLADLGNFPLWNSDFFRKDSRLIDSYSRHAHILDFDTLRLGRKLIENNDKADSFEFGVVVITEIGKERGNNLELKELKKSLDVCNQKNDLFNSWLKMVRHSATVDNYPFVRVITDEQRPSSWGADARELCQIVHIKDSGELNIVLPLFTPVEILHDWTIGKFVDLYYQYRYNRSDNTVLMYLFKLLTSKIKHYYSRTYNTFGYCSLKIQVESGTLDGELINKKYYLMNKKIYSKRFSTDCFSDFFTQKALRSKYGIDDLFEYQTEKASMYELKGQNSYFIRDLIEGLIEKK